MRKSNKTANHSMIYGFGMVLQHITSVVMLPIYTRFLTPEDYGIADLMAMGVEVVALLVGVISSEAVFRFYYDSDRQVDKNKTVFTIFLINLGFNAIGYLVIFFFASHAAGYLFDGVSVSNGENLVRMYGATILFQVFTAIPMAYIRAQQKPKLYVFFSLLRLVLAVSANLYFLVFLELHITGVVYAVFSFTVIHGFVMFCYMIYNTGVALSPNIARKVISFSWPLLFASLAIFIITYSDRLFIKHYAGVSEVGIYSLAYKFGFILISIAWGPFSLSWDSIRYEVVKKKNATEIFQSTFRMTQAFVLFCALGLAVFAQDLLRIMASQDFQPAYKLIGIIVFAHVFSIWAHYCMFGIFYSKKTVYKTYADWLCLLFTITFYFLMVPLWGALGAAWATFLSLGVRFLLLYYWSNKFYAMHLEWKGILFGSVVACFAYVLSLVVQLSLYSSIAFNILIMAGYLFFLWTGGVINQQDKVKILAFAKSFREKV